MPVPSNITTADAALDYIINNTGLSTVDLKQLANQIDTSVAGAKSVLLYSGGLGFDEADGNLNLVQSTELAEHIGENSPFDAKVATVGQTDAAQFIGSDEFRDTLEDAKISELGLDISNPTDEARLNTEISKTFFGESLPDGTRVTPGLWDDTSVRFINDNVTADTPVKTITPLAENRDTFTQAELDALRNSDAPSIDGNPKNIYDDIFDSSFNDAKSNGLLDADARVRQNLKRNAANDNYGFLAERKVG